MSRKHQKMVTVLSIALMNSLTKARTLHYRACGVKFQTIPPYIWNLAHIRHLTTLEVSYKNIFLINHVNLTQHIWSLKHFLEFINAECSFTNTNLKPVLQAMLEKVFQVLFIYYIRRIITIC